jgi:hypothetical protein
MPLITTNAEPVTEIQAGMGFTMTTPDGEIIWVIATGECLHSIDRSSLPDQFAGADVFTRNRKLIEGSASVKYDVEGTNSGDGNRDGCRVLIVRSDDLPDLEHY